MRASFAPLALLATFAVACGDDTNNGPIDTGIIPHPIDVGPKRDSGTIPRDAGTPGADAGGVVDAGQFNCSPQLVTLEFAGQAVTISGTPFGVDDSIRTSSISGTMTYDLCPADSDPFEDPAWGEYDHRGFDTGAFTLNVAGHVITGSPRPITEVHNGASDVWRFKDGPQLADPTDRTMSVDGVRHEDLELWISIVDESGQAVSSDDQQAVYGFTKIEDYPHTFSVSDDNGTLLIQLDVLFQQ